MFLFDKKCISCKRKIKRIEMEIKENSAKFIAIHEFSNELSEKIGGMPSALQEYWENYIKSLHLKDEKLQEELDYLRGKK